MKRIVNALGKLSCGKRAYAVLVLCATTAIALPAQTFTTLVSFDGADGSTPTAALVQAANGDLYGTTEYGGARGHGTVFKITPAGTLTTLVSFDGADGFNPYARLVQATNGDFYGTTLDGGANPAAQRRWRWHGLQNHTEWHADDVIQLLLPNRVRRRPRPLGGAGSGDQWGLVRDDRGRWGGGGQRGGRGRSSRSPQVAS